MLNMTYIGRGSLSLQNLNVVPVKFIDQLSEFSGGITLIDYIYHKYLTY